MHPLISCLSPTKTEPSIVKNAIKCFNDQSYPNKELILVSDECNPYLKDLEKLVCDDIKLFTAPNGSVIGSLRNISVHHANGEYIATWDDDDISLKDRLVEQYVAILKSKKDACYLTHAIIKNTVDNTVGLSKRNFCIDCTMLARKDNFPLYDENASYPNIEDLPIRDYYSDRNQIVWVNKPHLYIYNIHGENTCDYRVQKRWIDIII